MQTLMRIGFLLTGSAILLVSPKPGQTQLKKQRRIATQQGSLVGIAEEKNPFLSFTNTSYFPVATPAWILRRGIKL